jgi:hypothetical protein
MGTETHKRMKKTFTVFGIILFACLALIAEGSLRPA